MKWAAYFSKANEKLRKTARMLRDNGHERTTIVSFNLPAFLSDHGFKVCTYAGICAKFCYARSGHFLFPGAKRVRHANLEMLRILVPQGVAAVTDWLCTGIDSLSRYANIIRVHDSGDFCSGNFDRIYMDAWYNVAREYPDRRFYAYTKELLLLPFENKPENFSIVQSIGGKLDHMIDFDRPHSRIFPSDEAREYAGYEDAHSSDIPAIFGATRVGLVEHGSDQIRFTKAQRAILAA